MRQQQSFNASWIKTRCERTVYPRKFDYSAPFAESLQAIASQYPPVPWQIWYYDHVCIRLADYYAHRCSVGKVCFKPLDAYPSIDTLFMGSEKNSLFGSGQLLKVCKISWPTPITVDEENWVLHMLVTEPRDYPWRSIPLIWPWEPHYKQAQINCLPQRRTRLELIYKSLDVCMAPFVGKQILSWIITFCSNLALSITTKLPRGQRMSAVKKSQSEISNNGEHIRRSAETRTHQSKELPHRYNGRVSPCFKVHLVVYLLHGRNHRREDSWKTDICFIQVG